MRILHIIASANPIGGGPIEGIKQFGTILPGLGSINEVVSMDSPEDSFVKGFPLILHPLGPHFTSYAYTKKLVPWLTANAKNYDLIIVNGIWQYNSFGAWRALKKLGIPYFVFTHGMMDPWFKKQYPLKHLKKWLYWPWAEYRVLRDAKAVLFTCQEEMKLAPKSFWLYKAVGKVMNYGTRKPPQDSESLSGVFFNKYPTLRNKRLVIFLSRIHEKKGCDILIEAFSKVVALDDSLHLVMAGPDSNGLMSQLKSQSRLLGLENKITWTGMLKGDAKWGAYYASEVFALPSHQENFGIVVAEALGCGLPVLISNKVNIWREIEKDGAGIVEEDTVEGAEKMLLRWLNLSPDDKLKMLHQTKISFNNRFTVEAMAQSILSLANQKE